MVTIKAHFDGKTIVPDEPVTLPQGTSLTVHVESPTPVDETEGGKYMTGKQLAESEFVGMWKDRTDITDSVEFVNQLRERQRQNTLRKLSE
jgi:hypothetical protein